MKEGEDRERLGFDLLLQRSDFPTFFDGLAEEGLFDPSRNPGPVEADKPGYYRVPDWPPLHYLEAVARFAGDNADTRLAEKVKVVIRSVSEWRDSNDEPRDNYRTWWFFAKILSLLPSSTVSQAEIDLVPIWLRGQFDRMMAGHALADGALRKFLASDNRDDLAKACRLLYHLTVVQFVRESPEAEQNRIEPRPVFEVYWLKELINATAADFGKKAGKDGADIFLDRVTTVFAH